MECLYTKLEAKAYFIPTQAIQGVERGEERRERERERKQVLIAPIAITNKTT